MSKWGEAGVYFLSPILNYLDEFVRSTNADVNVNQKISLDQFSSSACRQDLLRLYSRYTSRSDKNEYS